MTTPVVWPDTDAVLRQLKGFQRDTVEYAFERLYRDAGGTRRFLVADEVGLGKTLAARGIVAKAVEHLRGAGVRRIDVVYICSNAQIARQNINRLNLTEADQFAHASRITLLPTLLKGLRDRPLNFVSFTLGTSFELSSRLGRRDERILLYWMLNEAWGDHGIAAANVLQGSVRTERFRERLWGFDEEIDPDLQRDFTRALSSARHAGGDSGPGLRERFEELCGRFSRARKTKRPREDRELAGRLIGELRAILAGVCLKALEPDLIILDEFQRFKHLLSDESDAGQLARELFEYSDDETEVRTLLLSATPYKMYTLAHERDEDDHHADFLRTVEFLQRSPEATQRFRAQLTQLRRALYRLADGDPHELPALTHQIEHTLRAVMSRTERIGTGARGGDRHGMLREVGAADAKLDVKDVRAYAELQRIADMLEQPHIVELWKSAPFVLNFMDEYRLKQKLRAVEQDPEAAPEIAPLLAEATCSLVSWPAIERYEQIDLGNARLRALDDDLTRMGAYDLLWVPPTLPAYRLGGGYRDAAAVGMTKRLVFSSWTIVPKTLATMLSYEAERRLFTALDPGAANRSDARRARGGRLAVGVDAERLTGMPVVGLLYPSFALARWGDPIGDWGPDRQAAVPTLADVLLHIEQAIAEPLRTLTREAPEAGREDEAWYWAAPILLDQALSADEAAEWLDRPDVVALWSGSGAAGPDRADSAWGEHIAQARAVLSGDVALGRPPADLLRVLAELALAGPGVIALRALARIVRGSTATSALWLRDAAALVASGLRTLFNEPEATALIRIDAQRDPTRASLPYWRQLLGHACAGDLGSALDEYAHVLRESLGLFNSAPGRAVAGIAQAMHSAMALRTSRLELDEILPAADGPGVQLVRRTLRAHFAMRFGTDKRADEDSAQHEDQVRAAFNSPFWPFVLVSTSVGQEGLDFHPYCHAVVHWNLPANPVDLEQREGRVHRYKGHAIRKNIAREFGTQALASLGSAADPWEHAFEVASRALGREAQGLIPFWVYAPDGGAYVERHVPALPFSKDVERQAALKRSLAVCRMVFGQPRQDDLLAYLLDTLEPQDVERYAELLRVDLAPPARG